LQLERPVHDGHNGHTVCAQCQCFVHGRDRGMCGTLWIIHTWKK
jgi:hypothetical protein